MGIAAGGGARQFRLPYFDATVAVEVCLTKKGRFFPFSPKGMEARRGY